MPPPMGSQILNGTHRTTLTDAKTPLFTVPVAAGEGTGGIIFARIFATDATDHQSLMVIVTWAVVNKAATLTTAITYDTANEAKAASSGTLTLSWAIDDNTNIAEINVTPTGSLTETTYYVEWTNMMVDMDHFATPV